MVFPFPLLIIGIYIRQTLFPGAEFPVSCLQMIYWQTQKCHLLWDRNLWCWKNTSIWDIMLHFFTGWFLPDVCVSFCFSKEAKLLTVGSIDCVLKSRHRVSFGSWRCSGILAFHKKLKCNFSQEPCYLGARRLCYGDRKFSNWPIKCLVSCVSVNI